MGKNVISGSPPTFDLGAFVGKSKKVPVTGCYKEKGFCSLSTMLLSV